ncbi:hypothetical protein ACIBF1_04430 [Spirillospora sp. NPDC050679]
MRVKAIGEIDTPEATDALGHASDTGPPVVRHWADRMPARRAEGF